MRISIADFLEMIERSNLTWVLEDQGPDSLPCVTCEDTDSCPLHAIYDESETEDDEDPVDYFEKGTLLGLRRRDVQAIADAADGRKNGRLRKRLLKACGLD
jgi:hypothetical protein